ncbi:MAG: hypothetical protein IJ055_08850 [Oscillospiraceae bacterium]|nr:hypothetical protein [Oscillospiraceae bacterium]
MDRKLLRQVLLHMGLTVWFAFFGAVYEHFSHEVYSYWMLYAFALPLVLGALPYGICLWRAYFPGERVIRLWDAAILTWTVGAVFQGVLDIYGTTNSLVAVYPVAGALLAVAAAVMCFVQKKACRPATSQK